MKETSSAVGARLRRLRFEHGWPKGPGFTVFRFTPYRYEQIEGGKGKPATPDEMEKIARILDVPSTI
jgi:hypothetical protein